MDISAVLILPFSALVALLAVAGTALGGRESPRLIWPFAVSSLLAVPIFFPLPAATEVGTWLSQVALTLLWAAGIGTVIGGLLARGAIAAVRWIRSR